MLFFRDKNGIVIDHENTHLMPPAVGNNLLQTLEGIKNGSLYSASPLLLVDESKEWRLFTQ
jgi:hypothetical protein